MRVIQNMVMELEHPSPKSRVLRGGGTMHDGAKAEVFLDQAIGPIRSGIRNEAPQQLGDLSVGLGFKVSDCQAPLRDGPCDQVPSNMVHSLSGWSARAKEG